jgi:hypothetical protein
MEPTPNPENKPETQSESPAAGQVIGPGGTTPGPIPENSAQPPIPTPSTEPIATPETYTFTPQVIDPNSPAPKKRFFKKPLVLLVVVFVLILGGSAAAYLGYYLPNKPENIWNKALINTGKGYDKLAEYSQNQLAGQSKGFSLSGTYKVSGSYAADGNFDAKSDGNNSVLMASLSSTGLKFNLEARAIKSTSNNPDVYFKVDGVKGLGNLLGGFYQEAANTYDGLDGKWYFVDHSLFDQYSKQMPTSLHFSQSDIKSILKAIGDASKEYVFTNDPSKMAFVVKQNVGKEQQDGRSVYHFKVAVNKQNFKKYSNALCTNLKNSSLKKLYGGNEKTLESALDCNDSSDTNSLDANQTADVWVDMHTKLIHKVKFTDTKDKASYVDFGQDYQGGDTIPFTFSGQEKAAHVQIKVTLNMKTNVLKLEASGKSSSISGSVDMTFSPNQAELKVEKPADARNIMQLIDDLGLGGLVKQ